MLHGYKCKDRTRRKTVVDASAFLPFSSVLASTFEPMTFKTLTQLRRHLCKVWLNTFTCRNTTGQRGLAMSVECADLPAKRLQTRKTTTSSRCRRKLTVCLSRCPGYSWCTWCDDEIDDRAAGSAVRTFLDSAH